MSKKRSKKSTLLFATVYAGFLGLLLIACGPNSDAAEDTDDTNNTDKSSQSLEPDKFALSIEDRSTNKNNFVAVEITPGSPDMNLGDFFVTASIVGGGIVKGAANKKGGKGLDYTADLNDCSVAALSCKTLKAKHSKQGSPIKFRAKTIPGAAIKQGDPYTLNVKIERKGDNPHTETQSIELTAKQDGEDSPASKKEHAPGTNVAVAPKEEERTPAVNSEQRTDPSDDATEEANTPVESPQGLVPDTDLPVTPNSKEPNTNARQRTDPFYGTPEAERTPIVNAQSPGTNAAVAPKEEERTPAVNSEQRTDTSDDATEEANTPVESPQGLVPDTDLPVTPNSKEPNTYARQRTDPFYGTPKAERTPIVNAQSPGNDAAVAPKEDGRAPGKSPVPDTDLPVTLNSKAADGTDKNPQGSNFNPNKVALSIEDRSTNKNNFVAVGITPDSPDMNLEDFFVTASIVGGGIVKGAANKKGGKGLDYTADLNDCSVAALSCKTLKAKHSKQGSPIKFRAKTIPDAAIKQGDPYTLNVKIERKGDNPHTETQSIELTAKQDGEDPPASKKEHAPGTNAAVAPKEVSSNDTDTSSQISTSDAFTVTLKNATTSSNVRNFVLVTIQPNSSGMALQDFFVTATLADGKEGTVMGSSGKNGNSFVYNSTLDTRSLKEIFLVGINCLGVNDTSFERGNSVSFKIEVKPGASFKQGDEYTLTVQIAYTGSNVHTETKIIPLTATKKSPVKERKRTSPRK